MAQDVHDIKTSLLLKNNIMKTKICKEIGEDPDNFKFNCASKNAAKIESIKTYLKERIICFDSD